MLGIIQYTAVITCFDEVELDEISLESIRAAAESCGELKFPHMQGTFFPDGFQTDGQEYDASGRLREFPEDDEEKVHD